LSMRCNEPRACVSLLPMSDIAPVSSTTSRGELQLAYTLLKEGHATEPRRRIMQLTHHHPVNSDGLLYPMMVIAAIAVIVFSIAGIASISGWLPNALRGDD